MFFCSLLQIYRVPGALWESDSTRGALALQESSGWVRPHSQEGHVRKYQISIQPFALLIDLIVANKYMVSIAIYMNYILCLMLSNRCGAEILHLRRSILQSFLSSVEAWMVLVDTRRGPLTVVIGASNVNIIFSRTEVGGERLCVFPLDHAVKYRAKYFWLQ